MGEVVKLSLLCRKSLMTLCHCCPACGVLYRVFTSTTMSPSLSSASPIRLFQCLGSLVKMRFSHSPWR